MGKKNQNGSNSCNNERDKSAESMRRRTSTSLWTDASSTTVAPLRSESPDAFSTSTKERGREMEEKKGMKKNNNKKKKKRVKRKSGHGKLERSLTRHRLPLSPPPPPPPPSSSRFSFRLRYELSRVELSTKVVNNRRWNEAVILNAVRHQSGSILKTGAAPVRPGDLRWLGGGGGGGKSRFNHRQESSRISNSL